MRGGFCRIAFQRAWKLRRPRKAASLKRTDSSGSRDPANLIQDDIGLAVRIAAKLEASTCGGRQTAMKNLSNLWSAGLGLAV